MPETYLPHWILILVKWLDAEIDEFTANPSRKPENHHCKSMDTKCKNNLVNLLAVSKGGALTRIAESTSLQADVVKCYYTSCSPYWTQDLHYLLVMLWIYANFFYESVLCWCYGLPKCILEVILSHLYMHVNSIKWERKKFNPILCWRSHFLHFRVFTNASEVSKCHIEDCSEEIGSVLNVEKLSHSV